MADSQRGAVYDSEHLVHRLLDRAAEFPTLEVAGSTITLPPERRFASLSAVQTYVDRVLSLNWVESAWPRAKVPITVRERHGAAAAHYERSGAVIAVPGVVRGDRWALRELVVLHEIAHHLADDETEAAHGPAFVGRLLELVDGILGPEVALLLRVTFADVGVRG